MSQLPASYRRRGLVACVPFGTTRGARRIMESHGGLRTTSCARMLLPTQGDFRRGPGGRHAAPKSRGVCVCVCFCSGRAVLGRVRKEPGARKSGKRRRDAWPR